MADKIANSNLDLGIPVLYKDLGSNTYAPVVATIASGSATTADQIQGNVASGVTDVGNPTKVGFNYNVSPTNVVTGSRVDGLSDRYGQQRVRVVASTLTAIDGVATSASSSVLGPSDQDSSLTVRPLCVGAYVNTGTTWNMLKGSTTGLYTKMIPTAPANRSITTSTTSQTLASTNINRTLLSIANDDTIDVWVNINGASATAGAGSGNKKIAANGGYLELEGNSNSISIIATSGSPKITAMEY